MSQSGNRCQINYFRRNMAIYLMQPYKTIANYRFSLSLSLEITPWIKILPKSSKMIVHYIARSLKSAELWVKREAKPMECKVFFYFQISIIFSLNRIIEKQIQTPSTTSRFTTRKMKYIHSHRHAHPMISRSSCIQFLLLRYSMVERVLQLFILHSAFVY